MSADPAGVQWWSRRAVTLHVGVMLAVPLCLLAGWWQATRALSGNGLSWVYTGEWPLFACLSVWCWWQVLHTGPAPEASAAARRGAPPGGAGGRPRWDRDAETDDLRAYNDHLARLEAYGPQERNARRVTPGPLALPRGALALPAGPSRPAGAAPPAAAEPATEEPATEETADA